MNSKKITWLCYEFEEVNKDNFFLDRFDKMNFKDIKIYFKLEDVGGLVPQESAIFLERDNKLYRMTAEGIKKFVINYMDANEALSAKMEGRI